MDTIETIIAIVLAILLVILGSLQFTKKNRSLASLGEFIVFGLYCGLFIRLLVQEFWEWSFVANTGADIAIYEGISTVLAVIFGIILRFHDQKKDKFLFTF